MSRTTRNPEETRQRLVNAAVRLMLRQGFAATSVDQICAEAGVTKGGFFHHFENKEALARAAVVAWGDFGTALYAEAWKDQQADPLKQVHRMLDIMSGFTEEDDVCTCMVGMLSQELAQTHPAIRQECALQLQRWTDNVAGMLAAAKKKHKPRARFDAEQAAWFLQAIWQGSMLLSKTCQTPEMTRANLKMARAYVDSLFTQP